MLTKQHRHRTSSAPTYELVDEQDADVRAVGDLAEELFDHGDLRFYGASHTGSEINNVDNHAMPATVPELTTKKF